MKTFLSIAIFVMNLGLSNEVNYNVTTEIYGFKLSCSRYILYVIVDLTLCLVLTLSLMWSVYLPGYPPVNEYFCICLVVLGLCRFCKINWECTTAL